MSTTLAIPVQKAGPDLTERPPLTALDELPIHQFSQPLRVSASSALDQLTRDPTNTPEGYDILLHDA